MAVRVLRSLTGHPTVARLAAFGVCLLVFLVAAPAAPEERATSNADLVRGAIDLPSRPDVSGVVSVEGWAIDAASPSGTGIDRVQMYLDGTFVRDAQYGRPRSDIGAAFGAQFEEAGWRATLDLTPLVGIGKHEIEVHIRATSSTTETVYTRSVWVTGPQRFGVNAHLLWTDASAAAVDLDQVRAGGLGGVRFDVAWDALQPTDRNNWSSEYLALLDDVIGMAAGRGLQPVLTVLGTPAWAAPTGGNRMSPPGDPNDYANAVAFLAARYASHLGLTIEIWNEPNQSQFWTTPSGPDAVAYANLLSATYPRVKSVAPGVLVLGGSVDFNDPAFLRQMYAAGAGGNFDALALHPYADANPPDATDSPDRSFVLALDTAHQIMLDQGDGDKPIWITEMGWSTSSVPDTARAEHFRRAVELVGARPWIAGFFAYGLSQAEDFPDYGLIAADGTPTASWLAYVGAVAGR